MGFWTPVFLSFTSLIPLLFFLLTVFQASTLKCVFPRQLCYGRSLVSIPASNSNPALSTKDKTSKLKIWVNLVQELMEKNGKTSNYFHSRVASFYLDTKQNQKSLCSWWDSNTYIAITQLGKKRVYWEREGVKEGTKKLSLVGNVLRAGIT